MSGPLATTTRFDRRAWTVLAVLCGTAFLEGLDVSMMGVALPSIRADLGLSTVTLQWVVSAFVLGYGGFVLVGGRAADLFGRRRMFLLWLAVFIAFSGLGGLATEGWMLLTARFVTGVAAGFLTPASISIITTSFGAGDARHRAILTYSGAGAAGFSMGMLVGGLLTAIDWRWVFFAPVVLATVLFIVAVRTLPDDGRPDRAGRSIDLPGALTVTGAMLLLVYAVVRAPDVAWATTVATLGASALLLAGFVAIERRAAEPLVRLGILRSRALVRVYAGASLFFASFMGFQFIVVLYLQELRDWSPLQTGLALLLAGLDALIAPTITPILVRRFGTMPVLFGGVLCAVLAYALFLPLGADWSYLLMAPTFLLIAIAFACAFGPFTIAATDGVDAREQGLAAGLLNVSVQFGAALGLAAVTAVNLAATGDGAAGLLDGYRAALVVPVVAATLSAVIVATGLRRGSVRWSAAGG